MQTGLHEEQLQWALRAAKEAKKEGSRMTSDEKWQEHQEHQVDRGLIRRWLAVAEEMYLTWRLHGPGPNNDYYERVEDLAEEFSVVSGVYNIEGFDSPDAGIAQEAADLEDEVDKVVSRLLRSAYVQVARLDTSWRDRVAIGGTAVRDQAMKLGHDFDYTDLLIAREKAWRAAKRSTPEP